MRKVISIIAALVMVMAMSVSVFAAESPVVDAPEEVVIPETDAMEDEGEEIIWDYGLGGISGAGGPAEAITDPDALEALGETEEDIEAALPAFIEKNFSEYDVPEDAKINVLGAFDLSSDDPKPVIVFDFDPDKIADGDTVYVLHYMGDGEWELMSGVVEDGKITITFENGLSPVYLFVVETADGEAATLAEAPKEAPADKVTSHKTGY